MKNNMEEMLKYFADMELLSPNDELSKLVESETEDELSEDMLDFVSAASHSEFDRFRRYLEESGKKK